MHSIAAVVLVGNVVGTFFPERWKPHALVLPREMGRHIFLGRCRVTEKRGLDGLLRPAARPLEFADGKGVRSNLDIGLAKTINTKRVNRIELGIFQIVSSGVLSVLNREQLGFAIAHPGRDRGDFRQKALPAFAGRGLC